MKYYKSKHKLPYLNYFNATYDDIRYMLVLDDYSELPELKPEKLMVLKEAYDEVVYNLDDGLDLTVPKLRYYMWRTFFEYLAGGKSAPYNKYFAKYRKKLDQNQGKFSLTTQSLDILSLDIHTDKLMKFENVEFESIKDLIPELKELYTYKEYLVIRAYVIERIDFKPKSIPNIYDEIAWIEMNLPGDRSIDAETCPVAKVMSYKKIAERNAKAKEQAQRQKQRKR